MSFEITIDRVLNIVKAVKDLTSKEVKVGVPAENADRDPPPGEGATVNNAQIGVWMEFGVPEKNVPARPFLVPGIQSAQADIVKGLRKAAEAAIDDNPKGVAKQLTAVGIMGQAAVQAKITDGPFVPLSMRTIEARARRGRKGAKKYLKQMNAGQTPDPGLVKPLMDTGALRQSISFVVVDKGKK